VKLIAKANHKINGNGAKRLIGQQKWTKKRAAQEGTTDPKVYKKKDTAQKRKNVFGGGRTKKKKKRYELNCGAADRMGRKKGTGEATRREKKPFEGKRQDEKRKKKTNDPNVFRPEGEGGIAKGDGRKKGRTEMKQGTKRLKLKKGGGKERPRKGREEAATDRRVFEKKIGILADRVETGKETRSE